MDAKVLVEALDGAILERSADGYALEGKIGIEHVADQGSVLRFDLIVPTTAADMNDYIWGSELKAGTTDKVVLVQRGNEVPDARVVGVDREGKGEGRMFAEVEQYRLTFEVPKHSLRAAEPLEIHVRLRDPDGRWIDRSIASSN